MRIWIMGIVVLLGWMGGSTYWYVCKVKGLCWDGKAAVADGAVADSRADSLEQWAAQAESMAVKGVLDSAAQDSMVADGAIVDIKAGPEDWSEVTQPYTVLFSFAGPHASEQEKLESHITNVAAWLARDGRRKVVLKGYTDDTAARENNIKLAQKRCDFIADMLIAKGVERERIITEALGEADPVATNDTPAGRRLNRRVVISILESS